MENNAPSDKSGIGERPAPTRARYVLRLYVSGTTLRSARAIASMRQICDVELEGQYDLDVIDVYQNPAAAKEDNIVALPTLVKLVPAPLRRLIGDLSDHERVLSGLDIVPKHSSSE